MADTGEQSQGIDSLKNFERALGHVRNSVRPLTLMSRDEVGACISPADRAKLNLQVAYGVTSLFYMFLRTQGVSPSKHPVKAELDRIREYFGRLQKVGKPPEQRTIKVDAEASRRFINSALSGDSVWKNAQGHHGEPKSAQASGSDPGIGRSTPAGEPENPDKSDTFVFVGIPLGKRKHGGSRLGGAEWARAQPDYADEGPSKKPKNSKGGKKMGARYHRQ